MTQLRVLAKAAGVDPVLAVHRRKRTWVFSSSQASFAVVGPQWACRWHERSAHQYSRSLGLACSSRPFLAIAQEAGISHAQLHLPP